MKPEKLSDALNHLDDDLIKETEKVRQQAKRRRKHPKFNWQLMGTLAACISLLIIGNVVVSKFVEPPVNPGQSTEGNETPGEESSTPEQTAEGEDSTECEPATQGEKQPTQESEQPTAESDRADETTAAELVTTEPMPELPALRIDGSMGNLGSGGGSHIIVSDLEDWISTPWTESATPERLPVYNNYKYNEYFNPYGFGREDMEKWVYYIVDAFETELLTMNYQEDVNYNSRYMSASTKISSIHIDGGGNIRITFTDLDLPEEYHMYNGLSDVESEQVLDRLITRFEKLLNYDRPENVIETDYSYMGTENHRYLVYDSSGDVTEALLNYCYNDAELNFDENGELEEIFIRNGLACAEKIDDYPTISADDARQLLLAGYYFSEGTKDFAVEEKNIAAIELLYPHSNQPEIIIPYYCFYVELPNETLDGVDAEINEMLTHYRACYVPAVDPRYIENMPMYGGFSQ